MKRSFLFVVMMAVMMAASVNLTSCGGDDDASSSGSGGGSIPSAYVGTWTCDEYCPADNTNQLWAMYEDEGWPPTTVTINGDGTCSGSGLVINGSGTCSIKKGSIADDGYYALITFYQGGKSVTAKVRTYMNDHRTGYVELQGYSDKWFVFKK